MNVFVVLLIGLLAFSSVQAGEDILTVTPEKCVTLRKGQTCYQSVRVKFTTAKMGDYCLKIIDQASPLQCWTGVDSASFRYSLVANSPVEFEVVDAKQLRVATARIVISWVYKEPRSRSRWRLF